MEINKTYLPWVKKYTDLYQVDSQWVKAIILTESSGNPYAERYESGYNYTWEVEKCAKKCNSDLATELKSQKTSWGLGQIMGAVAREQGHTDWLTQLVIPEINIRHICILIEKLKRSDKCKLPEDVFSAYNGGLGALKLGFDHKYPNQVYVDKVLKNLASV